MKPDFAADPADWVEDSGKGVVLRDSNGDVLCIHHTRYEPDPETGEMVPAHPPVMEDAATAEIVSGDLNDILSDVPADVLDTVTKHEEVTL